MINEQCCILVGGHKDDLWWGKRIKPTEGAPASVAFDAKFVLEQEEGGKNIVGFYHTHPSFNATPSDRDDRTMGAWVNCLGKNLVCVIDGVDGLKAWWYFNDEDPPVEYQVKKNDKIIFGITPELF